ncbi:O-acetylhomoserine (thiol)-lyase [Candidatus Planktophila vernalis]|jgi:O-acetylhomoserine (thiol)-lyase|uniref:O-acetylhomoserine (Thiol)-lyase n=1 Tax=Candidatus Planktophila vernalis TaxID=1884907 RepID=A0A249KSA1_9ACTN|nr:bifunctional o-acetylhomoserine/o-acetylserine sulfhydrylase [Candidatus Planktophila vernalis]ASY19585.1 O-acetylhomoserine (thiol)-lyase [Candidatus Planktophila vernalis]
MSENSEWSFETQQIHAGQNPDSDTGSRSLPIYQTTAYQFRDTQHAANLFGIAEAGNVYTRINNPTQDAVEKRIATLEGGVAALLVSSGMAATTLAIMNVAQAGDHVVSSSNVYGGTFNLFNYTLPKFGIEVTFVNDTGNMDAWRAAVKPNTKAFFGEGISNPLGTVLDLAGIAAVAHEAGVPWIVDNTIATPYVTRPFDHGVDIIVHSATKFLSGHGNAMVGAIVDSGNFDFAKNPKKFPGFNEPDPSYNNMIYAKTLGVGGDFGANLAYIFKARLQLLRDFGSSVSPFNAWLLAQGLETLNLRMDRHLLNAQALAEWLEKQPEVAHVSYAGLPSSPWYATAKKYAPKGAGAVFAFELKGGATAGRKFVEGLKLFSHVANIGDVRSLVIHPASTTHAQLSPEEQLKAGITPGMVRLSIGLENIEDIKNDVKLGFAAVKNA